MANFVRPDTTWLDLADGQRILIKRELTAGEDRARMARMSEQVDGKGLQLKSLDVGPATMVAYLLDWTLTDDDGQRVEIRGLSPDDLARTLDSLTPARFKEILKTIEAYEADQQGAFNPFSRERILSDLNICRAMGWSWDQLSGIPRQVYDVLVAELQKEADLKGADV